MKLHELALGSLVSLAVLVGWGPGDGVASTHGHERRPDHRRVPAPTVFFIGVQHAPGLLLSERLSPGHVRAAIEAIGPDLVCVESNPEWFARGQHYRVTYEAFGVAVPWARARNLPVEGVDWIGDNSGDWSERERRARVDQEARTMAEPSVDPGRFRYGASRRDQLRLYPVSEHPAFDHLNSERFFAEKIAWLDGGKAEKGSPQHYIAERDRRIASYITAAVAKHGSKRIAVVIGATHVGNVTRELRARDVAVGDLRELLTAKAAPWDTSADAHLSTADLAAVLGEGVDGEGGVGLAREREDKLLKRLGAAAAGDPAAKDWFDHCKARRAFLDGDLDAARALWMPSASTDRRTGFPYVGESWRRSLSVQQLALLDLGRIADLAQDRSGALGFYARLLKTIVVPPRSDDEHSDFERLARAHNAVRALQSHPYTHARAFPLPQAETAASIPAAASPPPELALAWKHLRDKRWDDAKLALKKLDATPGLAEPIDLECRYLGAAIAIGTGDVARAQAGVADLEARVTALEQNHWLRREVQAMKARLSQMR